jgi:hypothetical protein
LVLRPLFALLCQPQIIDGDDCGAIGGMRNGRRNRSTGRKPAPVPLCPPQIPHDLTRDRTWAAGLRKGLVLGVYFVAGKLLHCWHTDHILRKKLILFMLKII